MKELDKVLQALINAKAEVLSQNATLEEQTDFKEALIENYKSKIIHEIKEEYKAEITEEVKRESKQSEYKQKLKDLHELMRNGFILAFIVGLAVNQVTDIISFVKGASSIKDITSTVIIAIILIAICIVYYLYNFFKQGIEIFNENK